MKTVENKVGFRNAYQRRIIAVLLTLVIFFPSFGTSSYAMSAPAEVATVASQDNSGDGDTPPPIDTNNDNTDVVKIKEDTYVPYINKKGKEEIAVIPAETYIEYEKVEKIKIALDLTEAYLVYEQNDITEDDMLVSLGKDLEFSVVTNKGFQIDEVTAKSGEEDVEISLKDSKYKILGESVDENLIIKVTTKEEKKSLTETPITDPNITNDPSGSGIPDADNIINVLGTNSSISPFSSSSDEVNALFDIPNDPNLIALQTGLSSTFTANLVAGGTTVDGLIIAIPKGKLTNISTTASNVTIFEHDGYQGKTGDFFIIVMPSTNVNGSFTRSIPIDYSFASGITPDGQMQEIKAYVYEAVKVATGTGEGGSDFNLRPAGLSAETNNTHILKATSDEEFSITKTLISSHTGTSGTLEPRPYTDVASGNNDTFEIEYAINLTSTGNPDGIPNESGRVYQKTITVTDTLTGYLDPSGAPINVEVKDGDDIIPSTLVNTDGGEYILSFDADSALDSDGKFSNKTYTVVASFSKAAYTQSIGEAERTDLPAVIKNTASMVNDPKTGETPQTIAPSEADDVYVGYIQESPVNPSFSIIKKINVSGRTDVYNSTYQGYYPSESSTMAFTLTPKNGNGVDTLTATVEDDGTLLFPKLVPGTTYELAENPAIANFTAFTPIDVVVSNIDSNTGLTTVKINDIDYANNIANPYEVINETSTLQRVVVNVEKQLKNQFPSTFERVENTDDVTVTLSNAGGIVSSQKTAGGSVTFEGVVIGTDYTVSVSTPAGKLTDFAKPADLPFTATAGTESYQLQYKYNYGSFQMGKQFVGPDGTVLNIPFNVQFALYDTITGDKVDGSEFTITNQSAPANNPVHIIDKLFPAGTYYIRELSVKTGNPLKDNPEYPLITGNDIQVVIGASEFGATPTATSNVTMTADGLLSNKSSYGQLKIKNFTIGYEGAPLSLQDFAYEITNANGGKITVPSSNLNFTEINLPAGKYTVTQTVTKDGYVQLGTPQDVTITGATKYHDALLTKKLDNGEWVLDPGTVNVQTVGFINALKPTLTARKVQANARETAVAATFGLYKIENGYYVYTNKTATSTDRNSLLSVSGLEIGEYAFIEQVAPSGYVQPDYVNNETFYEDGKWKTNIPVTTSLQAEISTKTISYSNYAGYSPQSDNTQTVEFANSILNIKLATINIKMVDSETGNNVAGSTFILYDSNGKTLSTKVSTGGDVTFDAELTAGTYTIKQTAMGGDSADYVQRTTDIKVVVAADGKITVTFEGDEYQYTTSTPNEVNNSTTIAFSNAKKPSAELVKMGETDVFIDDNKRKEAPLKDAVFDLRDKNDTSVRTITSDEVGKIVLDKLDPNLAPYKLVETSAPTVGGKEYTLADPKTITIVLEKNGSSENYRYVIEQNADTILNELNLYNVNLEKFNLNVSNGAILPGEGFPAINAEFQIWKKDADGNYSLVDTIITGTGAQVEPPSATAISRPLPNGIYQIREVKAGLGSADVGPNGPGLHHKDENGNWVLGTQGVWAYDFEIKDADADLTLGNTAVTGGPGEPHYIRIAGQKVGLISDGTGYEPDGVLNDVVFNVYAGYKNANGEWVTAGSPLTTVKTGKVDVGGAIKYGYFLTRFIKVDEIDDALAATLATAGISNPAKALVFEELGPLPEGYKPGKQVVVEIPTTFEGTFTTLSANGSTPEIENYAGEGQLTISKFDLANNGTELTNSSYEIYYATKNGEDYTIGTKADDAVITAKGGVTKTLTAGYYFIKEKRAPNDYNLYGEFAVDNGAKTSFTTDKAIGPVMIKGNGQATIKVYNKIMPKLSIVNTFDGSEKTGLNAIDVTDPSSVDLAKRLPDGTFKITETGLNPKAAEEYAMNTRAANGIDVTVNAGSITLKVNGESADIPLYATNKVPTVKPDVYGVITNNSGDVKLYINHEYLGSLTVNKGYIDAIGQNQRAHDELTKAIFEITPSVGGPVVATLTWEKGKTNYVNLAPGTYIVTETHVDSADKFNVDTNPVYIKIEATGRIYLQRNDGNIGTEAAPLTSANSPNGSIFYNKIDEGQLVVNKRAIPGNGETLGALLLGAEFALYKKDATGKPIEPAYIPSIPEVSGGKFQINVPEGDYFVKETKAPAGYDLRTDFVAVHVTPNQVASGDALLDFVDPEMLGFKIKKTAQYPVINPDGTISGTEPTAVGGIQFKLYKFVNNVWTQVDDDTTDARETNKTNPDIYGTISYIKSLGVGEYALQEIVPDDMKYIGMNPSFANPQDMADDQITKIIVEDSDPKDNVLEISATGPESGNFVNGLLTVENTFLGQIFVAQKFDFDTNDPLEGALFGLYSDIDCTDELRRAVSGADGRAVFDPIFVDVPGSAYYVKEIAAPSGYYLSDLYDKTVKPVISTNGSVAGNHVANFYDKKADTDTYGQVEIGKSYNALIKNPLRLEGFNATYKLTMQHVNNAMPLLSYSVSDDGLNFFKDTATGVTISKTDDNAPKYSLSNVKIKASTAQEDSNPDSSKAVWAQVNGSEWQELDAERTFTVSGTDLIINYSGTNPESGSPTPIGINFIPGEVTYDATIEQHIQDKSKKLVPEVGLVRNSARVNAVTSTERFTSEGVSEQWPLTDSDECGIAVTKDVRPIMSIEKELKTSTATVSPGGNIEYEIKLTNDGASDITDPVIVDVMDSTQMSLAYDRDNNAMYTVSAPPEITKTNFVANGGATPVWAFEGTLPFGETITISYTANVLAVVKGDRINNNAYGTAVTKPELSYSSEYPNGASFKEKLNEPTVTAGNADKYAALNTAVGFDAGLYVYASAPVVNVKREGAYMTLKSVSVDDGNTWFSSSAAPVEVSAGGTLTYKLSLSNDNATGSTDNNIYKINIEDNLPAIADGRGSEWGVGSNNMVFNDNTVNVTIPGRSTQPTAPRDYNVSYTGGSAPKLTIKFNDTFGLMAGEVLEITYKIVIPAAENFDWDKQGYTNTYNSFEGGYHIEKGTRTIPISSNRPAAKLIPDPINIQGNVWNDIERNGLYGGTDLGIKGAQVKLISSDTTINRPVQTTGEDGFYTFTGLPSSYNGGPTYTIEVTHPANGQVWEFVATKAGTWAASPSDASHIFNVDTQEYPVSALTGNTGELKLTKTTNIVNAGLLHSIYKVTYKDGASAAYPVTAGTMPDNANTTNSEVEATFEYTVMGQDNNYDPSVMPERPGFTFVGWEVTSGGALLEDEYGIGETFKMPYSDVELTAKWEIVMPELSLTGSEVIYDANNHGTTLSTSPGSILVANDTIQYFAPDGSSGWIPTGSAITVGATGPYFDSQDWAKNVTESTPIRVEVKRGNELLADLTADVIVMPRPVMIITGTASKDYDGTELKNALFTIEPQSDADGRGLVTGETISLETLGTVTHVNEGEATNDYIIDWTASTALIDNYIIEETIGMLSITPAPIVINTDSATKVFDGNELTADGRVTGLVTGEQVDFETTGTRTIVGTSVNTYELEWTGNTVTADVDDYYIAGEILGNLVVTPLPVITTTVTPDPVPAPTLLVAPGNPESTIGDQATPLAQNASWALLNLMLTIATAVLMIMLLITYFTRKREEENEDDDERTTDEDDEEKSIKLKRHGLVRIFSIVATIIAIVIFVLTEDMTLPMVFVDRYTIWHAIIAALTVVIGVLSMKKYKEIEEDDEEDAEPNA